MVIQFLILFNFIFVTNLRAGFKEDIREVDRKMYQVSKEISNVLTFKVKPEGIDKKIEQLINIKSSNTYFDCKLDLSGKLIVKVIGFKGFKEIKNGLVNSFLLKYNQYILEDLTSKYSSFSFTQPKDSKFKYKSNYNSSLTARLNLIIKKNRINQIESINSRGHVVTNYSFRLYKNKNLLDKYSVDFFINKNLMHREHSKLLYKKFKTYRVIDKIVITKTNFNLAKSISKVINKINFYDYQEIKGK